MTPLLRLILATSMLCVTGCRGHREAGATPDTTAVAVAPAHDVDRAGMNPTLAAGDDFYRYANGGWLTRNEIPADRSSHGAWQVLFDQAQLRTRALLDAAAAAKTAEGSDERKI